MLHASGWSFIGMHVFWWLFWFALITMASTAFTPIARSRLKSGELALDILRRRYAAGEVTGEEYERRKATLERDEPVRTAATHTH